MAGKTFHGVGFDGETPSVVPEGTPAAEDDSREQYSGPTVVDDAKIAESLKRLRSLDQAPAVPIGGISVSVVDAGSAEPTRIDDRPFVAPAKAPPLVAPGAAISRPTAVGHSVGPSVISQQNTPQLDPLRGTMFGHSIHLPDVATPETAPEDLSSGALVVIPRPTAEEMQPFLPDRTTRPAQHHPQFAGVAQPLRRMDLFHEPDTRTEVVSGFRQRIRGRTALVVVAVAAAAGMAFAWIYSRDGGGYAPPSPPAPVALPPAPAAVVPPPPARTPAAEAVLPTPPAPAAVEVPAAVNAQPEAAPATAHIETGEPNRPRASTEDGTSKRSSHRDRRQGPGIDDGALMPVAPLEAKAAQPAEAKAEAKAMEPKAVEPKAVEPKAVELKAAEPKALEPKAVELKAAEPKSTKTGKKKKVELEEDPDATLPPSE